MNFDERKNDAVGLFVQYFDGDMLITIPEEIGIVSNKSAWHFGFSSSGEYFETYSNKQYINDGVAYKYYRKDSDEYAGFITYGGLHHTYPFEMWDVRDLLKEYGHRTVLPFIAVYGIKRDSRVLMPEFGEDTFRMVESHLCQKLFYVAGYQRFIPCDYSVEKNEDGKYKFIIYADGQPVYQLAVTWDKQQRSFSDYQNQIRNPWEIDKVIDPDDDSRDLPFT